MLYSFYKLNKICIKDIMPRMNINNINRESITQEKHPPIPYDEYNFLGPKPFDFGIV